MTNKIEKICVFCGANKGIKQIYADAARQFASVLLQAKIELIYGGANIGLMGEIADEMLIHGGKVIGVMPQFLVEKEVAHTRLNKLYIVKSMHERKEMMFNLADAFVMLPGGTGSLDEFFEIITWAQLGFHNKPRGILNVDGYYDYLLKFIEHAVSECFLTTAHKNRILVEEKPEKLIKLLWNYNDPLQDRWQLEGSTL